MNETVTIYHNPRCSKSRQTLALIEEAGIQPQVVRYLETPPTEAELVDVLRKLNMPLRDLIRTKEPEYQALGLDDTSLSDAQVIHILITHPKLIERPVIIKGEQAVIGRPPENVLSLLG